MNPEFDASLEGYFRTVPLPERTQALGEILYHIADRLPLLGLYYLPLPGAVADRVQHVSSDWPTAFITWNVHEWDVRR
jgi:hypothetical protein